jgi:hypothetical protein
LFSTRMTVRTARARRSTYRTAASPSRHADDTPRSSDSRHLGADSMRSRLLMSLFAGSV